MNAERRGLFGLARATKRMDVSQPGPKVLRVRLPGNEGRVTVVLDSARCHGVGSHALGAVVHRDRPRQAVEARPGGSVIARPGFEASPSIPPTLTIAPWTARKCDSAARDNWNCGSTFAASEERKPSSLVTVTGQRRIILALLKSRSRRSSAPTTWPGRVSAQAGSVGSPRR